VDLASGSDRELRDVVTLVDLEIPSRKAGVREVEQKPATGFLDNSADRRGQIRCGKYLPVKIVEVLDDHPIGADRPDPVVDGTNPLVVEGRGPRCSTGHS